MENKLQFSEKLRKKFQKLKNKLKPDKFLALNKKAATITNLGWIGVFISIIALAASDNNILSIAKVLSFINFFVIIFWSITAVRTLLYFNLKFSLFASVLILLLFMLNFFPLVNSVTQPIIVGIIMAKTINLDEFNKINYGKRMLVCLVLWGVLSILICFLWMAMVSLSDYDYYGRVKAVLAYSILANIGAVYLRSYIIIKISNLQEEYDDQSPATSNRITMFFNHLFVIIILLAILVFIAGLIVVRYREYNSSSYNAQNTKISAPPKSTVQSSNSSIETKNYNSTPVTTATITSQPSVNNKKDIEPIIPKIGNLAVRIKQGMNYTDARRILINDGWQTMVMHRMSFHNYPVCYDHEYNRNTEECKYFEIEDCSGTGMGYCSMFFYDGSNTYLHVVTQGGGPPDAEIENWSEFPADEIDTRIVNDHTFEGANKTEENNPPAQERDMSNGGSNLGSQTTINNEVSAINAEESEQLGKQCKQVYRDIIYYNSISRVCFNKLFSDDDVLKMFSQKFMAAYPKCLEITRPSDDEIRKFGADIMKSMDDLNAKKGLVKFCKDEMDYFNKVKSKYNLGGVLKCMLPQTNP